MPVRVTDAAATTASGRALLDGVSVCVAPGSWLGVIGPNGAGKTTLLHAIAGVQRLERGRVELFGDDVAKLSRRAVARTLALLPQFAVMPSGMTALEYALLGRNPHLASFSVETDADIDQALAVFAQMNVEAFANREVQTLSGGERQRLLLARAVIQDTPVVLLDEPTTALDIGHQQDVLEIVDELRRTRGLVVISTMHDLTLAGLYADRLLLLDGGRVRATGEPEMVLTEDRLRRHFGGRVAVVRGPDGPVIAPRRDGRNPRHDR